MSRLHRFLLLCLLAVAIPLQGFAAVAMTHCGAAPASLSMADDMDMSMDVDMHHDQVDSKSDSHKGSCSACAACCVVAAPGTAWSPPAITPLPVAVADLSASSPRVDFLTDGPERPPRLTLA